MRILLSLFLCTSFASAQTSYPMITHTIPVAVQRGKTTEIIVEGQMNFDGVYQMLVEGTGVKAEILPTPMPPKGKNPSTIRSVKLRLTMAKDASLGVREFRLASKLGISSLGQLLVVDSEVISESGDNNSPYKPQLVSAPCAISGRIEVVEDVDHYRFSAKSGQTITFDVFCSRLQDKIHDLQKHADPLIVIYDSTGKELSANDDGIFADPLLSYTFTKDDDYILQIRDAKYDGDPRWAYAVTITDKPYISQMSPLAWNPGNSGNLEPVGSARLFAPKIAFQPPKELGLHALQVPIANQLSNPTPCIVTALPLISEQEPNDSRNSAQLLSIPSGINGQINKRRDNDYFRFRAAKGKSIRFEVFARRFNTILTSRLDSFLEIQNSQGNVLASNDDLNGKDSGLVFTPPDDGEYFLRIRDLNNKGGEGFIYYLEADFAKPDFTLKCDPSKAMIGPGSRTAWYVHVNRLNGFNGTVKIEVRGLPKGITVNPLTIPPSMTQGLLVLRADPDATKPLAANVEIFGTAEITKLEGKLEKITRKAIAVEEIYLPGGGRGRLDVRMQSVAITESSDILDVSVKPEKLILKPGQEVKLEVQITRRNDYDKEVSLDIPLRHLGTIYGNTLPPGVSIVEGKSKTLIGAGSSGHITLKVDPNAAPIEEIPIAVLAHVSINFVVKISYSSKPILLTIQK